MRSPHFSRTAAAAALASALLAGPALSQSGLRPGPLVATIPGSYIVEHVPGPQLEATGFRRIGVRSLDYFPEFNFSGVVLPQTESTTDAALANLAAQPGVRAVYPDAIETLSGMPNDPRASELWMIPAIRAAEAWGAHSDAAEIVVAVIDSGVFTGHEDLRDNLWVNEDEIPGNGVDDDNNGMVDDVHGYDFGDDDGDPNPLERCSGARDGRMEPGGHGTHVAGTVGAVGNNGTGVVGVAQRVKIMALKVSSEEIESCRSVSTLARFKAVAYAIENGADIINMSLGGAARYALDEALLKAAAERNVLVVVAAGNEGVDNDPTDPYLLLSVSKDNQITGAGVGPTFPAAWDTDTLVAVAATRRGDGRGEFVDRWRPSLFYNARVDQIAYNEYGIPEVQDDYRVDRLDEPVGLGSNYGGRKNHIAAPGQTILSAAPGFVSGRFTSEYAVTSGTSMASPAVAGAAAVVWSAFPEQSAVWVKRRLMETARRDATLSGRVSSGGQLDLYAALCADGAPRRLPNCETGAAGKAPAVGGVTAPVAPIGQAPVASQSGAGAGETTPVGSQNINEVIEW